MGEEFTIRYDVSADVLGDVEETVTGSVILGAEAYTHRDKIVVELESHADFIPLCPGDWVTIDPATAVVTGVERMAPMFTALVFFHEPADLVPYSLPTEGHPAIRKIQALLKVWRNQGYVTQHTNFEVRVSAQSWPWLEQILKHPYIREHELIRTPETRLNYSFAVQHPALDGDTQGPWE
jgi:hypothetical protein